MTLLQLFVFHHLSISNSHAIYLGMKPAVLWRLLLLVHNALVRLFSNTRHGCPISFVPPNYIKSRPVSSPVHQVPYKTGQSCLQYLQQCPTEGCGQQFGSSSTVELSTALGKQCRKQHSPGSWAESGANLLGIKGILSNNT